MTLISTATSSVYGKDSPERKLGPSEWTLGMRPHPRKIYMCSVTEASTVVRDTPVLEKEAEGKLLCELLFSRRMEYQDKTTQVSDRSSKSGYERTPAQHKT